MAKKASSKRNRHTGHINAFKQSIINSGRKFKHRRDGHIYYRALVGGTAFKMGGYTIVRAI